MTRASLCASWEEEWPTTVPPSPSIVSWGEWGLGGVGVGGSGGWGEWGLGGVGVGGWGRMYMYGGHAECLAKILVT